MIATPAEPSQESGAQRVERIKRERAPWSILDDIHRYAREGFASISDDDLNVRFRAWGLYTQGDGRGTRGEAVHYFMMRLRTPNGFLSVPQVRVVADLADRYGRGVLDITNRQNFQLHWLRIEDVPAIWEALAAVGWTSQGSCGDVTRTVTGCPLAGIDAGEIIDASPIALAVDRALNGNPEFANLPRKFKISISGCAHWCAHPEINDIGVTPARKGREVGFHIRVGGGLSTRPHLGVRLNAFLRPEQVLDVVKAAAAIFRDSDELRTNRAKARLKFLFISHGWTAASFLAEVERRLGVPLEAAGDDVAPPLGVRDHVGVHPQRQLGLHYAGVSVLSGRISPEQLRHVASLSERHGDGTLRNTTSQNIVVLNIPRGRLAAFAADADLFDLSLTGSHFRRGVVSCTGSEFCKLAITETKAFSMRLAHDLEQRMPGFSEAIRLHVAGCPNSCGQQWIADVGLQGVQITAGEESVDGFDLFVGGGLGAQGTIAHRVGFRTPATGVVDALERLFRAYCVDHMGGESFRSWTARVGDAHIKATLSGRVSA